MKQSSREQTWTLTKRKVNAFKTLHLTEQCIDTALALVTELNGDASGVSSWHESSDFVATENHSG